MSAPGSYVEPEERERRLHDLANRLIDEERVEPDTVIQSKREYANIKQDLSQEFLKFIKISEECELDRAILEEVVYEDIAEEIHAALKKFDNIWQNTGRGLQEVLEKGRKMKWGGDSSRKQL